MNSNELTTKRSRATNFSLSEQNVLLGLIAKHKEVILADSTYNTKISTSLKIQTWNKICAEFQEITKVHRTSYCLRTKWDNIKRRRRLEGKVNQSHYTGCCKSGIVNQNKEPDDLLALFTSVDGEDCGNEFTDLDESSCNSSRSLDPPPPAQKPSLDIEVKIKSEPHVKRKKSNDASPQPSLRASAKRVVVEGVPYYYSPAPDPLAGDAAHAQSLSMNGRAVGTNIEVEIPKPVVPNMKQKLEMELLNSQLANAAAQKRRLRIQETKDKLEIELLKANLENARSTKRLRLMQEEKEKIEIELLKTNLENA